MKPINKKILIAVAFIATIVLVTDCILFFAAEAISGTAFGITALISAPLSIVPIMFLIAPGEMKEQFNNANIARLGFLPRTKESSLFEAASALLLVSAWIIALARHTTDYYIIGIVSVCAISLLVEAYFTNKWWLGTMDSDNMQQLMIRARFKRILAVEAALYCLLTVIPGVNQTFVNWTFLLIAIMSVIWFIAVHFRSKQS